MKTFFDFIYPLNICWIIDEEKFSIPHIIIGKDDNREFSQKLRSVLDKISLRSLEYAQEVLKLRDKHGEDFYKSSHMVALLVKFPFLVMDNDYYFLLAPHLLLRKIEFSILSSFIEDREKGVKLEALTGPLGDSFEKHCAGMLKRVFPDHKSSFLLPEVLYNYIDKETGEEVCDVIINDPKYCFVFEEKYKLVNLAALDVSIAEVDEIQKWLDINFFHSGGKYVDGKKYRKGALVQLDIATQRILDNVLGYEPENIIPVIVLNEEVIFQKPLLQLLEMGINENKLFRNDKIKPILFISECELDYLTSLDFEKSDWNFKKLLKERSINNSGRSLNWITISKKLGLKSQKTNDKKKIHDKIFDKVFRQMKDQGY